MRMNPRHTRFPTRMYIRTMFAACIVVVLIGSTSTGSRADVLGRDFNRHVTSEFFEAYLAVGLLLPLTGKGPEGKRRVFRTLETAGITILLTEGLKGLSHEDRPDHSGHDSFPSAHASLSFAIATMQSAYHPSSAPLWCAGAALISLSRVDEGKHFGQDVIAGAALGYGVARWELSRKRGIILQPLIGSRESGLMAVVRF